MVDEADEIAALRREIFRLRQENQRQTMELAALVALAEGRRNMGLNQETYRRLKTDYITPLRSKAKLLDRRKLRSLVRRLLPRGS